MDKYSIQFIGSPCGEHGSYTFYKGFKYCKDGIWKVLNLGEFFYVRTSRTAPISIAELQLLWADRGNGGHLLSSCRLYYLPDHIPNGRTQFHGQDEVVANHNKVVLKLHDLLQWVCDDIIWPNGTKAISNIQQHSKTEDASDIDNCSNSLWISSGLNIKEIEKSRRVIESPEIQERPRVHIVSYPNYCRYKAVLKRIENMPERMLTDAYVTVLGGIVTPYRNTKLLFCRDTTDIPSLINHNKICDELAPNLKGRPRKKRSLQKGSSVDEDYEPAGNCSSSSKENDDNDKAEILLVEKEKNKSLLKGKESRIRPKVKITPRLNKVNEEARFIESLNQFMEVEKRPIDRIPHLGFKKIDLFLFFNEVKKVGGYDAVCDQRKWKQIYDQLGGSPGSTSAATCTRRHYEKLLLSYEKHLKGEKVITPPATKVKKITCNNKDVPQPVVASQAQSKEQNKDQSKGQTKDQSLKPAMKMLLQKPRQRVKKPRAKMLKDHVREMEERKRLESLKAQQLGALQSGEAMPKNDVSVLQIKSEGQPLAITPIQAGMHHPTNPALALAAASSTDKTNSTLPPASYPILKCVNPASIFATIKHDGQPMAATVHTIPNPGIQFVNTFHPAQIKEEPKAEKANTLAATSGQLQSLPTTSRASVIQHTHGSEGDLITNKPGMVQPCDLILRQKTDTQRKVEKESKEVTDSTKVQATAPEDTIIITPRLVQPFFSNLGFPQMMLSNQFALMRNNFPQLLQAPYMKPPQFNHRVDTSKKRQTHTQNGTVSNSMYSTPEQEEPCDLSLPKKRKVSHNADTKFLKSTNHLSHHAMGHRESGNRSKHGKSSDRYFHKNASHLSKVKMTPDTRGSITQGVIDSKKKLAVPNSQVSPLKGSKAESSRFTLPQVPGITFNPIPGILEGAQKNQLVFQDIKPPLLTAACPTILSPRFISAPLLSPQLLQVPREQAAAIPFDIRQRMFLPPFTSAGLVTPTKVSSDAKHSPVYRA
ncbi:AT-rich interactive domain-containing protein 5B-like [Anneissia japonica]|uniref:AT-rich interactive domain-containing protein 5B-like n=1 Tax=Anneissia japonica TaxID=1529436 RepID=UPI0014257C32|nr:AT-rich interactive domain-containing protein 5B-like [Anneissia japonica]